jgi:hypothetical protein
MMNHKVFKGVYSMNNCHFGDGEGVAATEQTTVATTKYHTIRPLRVCIYGGGATTFFKQPFLPQVITKSYFEPHPWISASRGTEVLL